MKRLLILVTLLLVLTIGHAHEESRFGDEAPPHSHEMPEEIGFVSAGKVERTWELTLIQVDGKFVDLNYKDDWLFHDRESCLRNGIYRMQWSIDNQHAALRAGKAVATYTQYLGFVCEEVEK